jgi:hypothetical protein
VKYLLLPILLLFSVSNSAGQAGGRDTHFREPGTGPICARSAFAHGYRHGYEEGYHLGNIDINLGRHARVKFSEIRESALRYSPEFGPKKSFAAGFQQGLKAGYNDGFIGRKFRAVESLRSASVALDENPTSPDPANFCFDQGVLAGYNQGLHAGQKDAYLKEHLDFAGCSRSQPAGPEAVTAQASFCDGYQRGYRIGHADGLVLAPDARALASK